MHQFKLAAVLFAAIAMVGVGMPQAANATESNELNKTTMEHPTYRRHHHRRPVIVGPHRRPYRMGSYIGLGGVGNYFFETGDSISKIYKGGGGLALFAGFRMNPSVAIEVGWNASFQSTNRSDVTGTTINNAEIQCVYAGGKVFFMPTSTRIEPFFEIDLAAYVLTENFVSELTGFGLRIGGGIDIRLSPWITFGARLLYNGFYVDNAEASYYAIPTESAFLNTVNAEINIQFYF